MSDFQSRMLAHNDIPGLMAFVSNNANARWPQPSYLLSSDVAWRISGDTATSIRLWFDQRGVAAYAWYGFNGPSEFDLRVDREYDVLLTQDVISWLEQRRRQDPPMVPWLIDLASMEEWEQAIASHGSGCKAVEKIAQIGVFDCASHRIDLLLEAGYRPAQHFGYYLSRSLKDPIPEPVLPDGWRIRHVLESDFEARVAVHRDAWFGSSFDLKRYLEVRAIDIFDPELDLVAETAEGEFVSYCIGWIDEPSGIGSFEPVGTPPRWRRQGLGRQVQYEGLRRMKAKGMHSAKIGTAGFNDRAYGLYTSCGFGLMDRCRTYIKTLESKAQPMATTAVLATIQERDILANLMRVYRHDMSEFSDEAMDEHGLFRLGTYFDQFWSDAQRYPFLIRADGRIAGFALVRELEPQTYSMSEFFIARGFRRKNVGANAAKQIFDQLRGTWHVAEMQTNTPAQRFWRKLIRDYTDNDYVETWSNAAPTGPKQIFHNVTS